VKRPAGGVAPPVAARIGAVAGRDNMLTASASRPESASVAARRRACRCRPRCAFRRVAP